MHTKFTGDKTSEKVHLQGYVGEEAIRKEFLIDPSVSGSLTGPTPDAVCLIFNMLNNN